VRGSPIRTPSDQRSVGSSPRLIAASHVLHRLLMPRHPPYALNNLTNTHKQTLDKNRPDTSKATDRKRCSRPLCSSQPTTSHHPDGPTRPGPPTGGRRCETRDGPARRSVVRSLRTQQRAYDQPPPPATFHAGPKTGSTSGTCGEAPAELVSVPPSSTTQTTRGGPEVIHRSRAGMALDRHPAGGRPAAP
jgi:hypothetical protein